VLVVGLVELGDTVLVNLAAASLKLGGGRQWRPVWIMGSSCANETPDSGEGVLGDCLVVRKAGQSTPRARADVKKEPSRVSR
jgi:hypothetical protein